MRVKLPPPDVVPIDPKTGQWVPDYYDFFKNLERLRIVDLADVSTTAPTNGQVLIYVTADKLWEPGAN